MRRVTGRVIVVCLLAACARPPAPSGVDGCGPVTYALDRAATPARLIGTFGVTLVATSGDSSGRTVAGRLELRMTTREDAALVGSADLPVEAVGALRLGALAAGGDSAPGVALLGGGADRPSFLLRLGSEANAAGEVRFDGGYTVLEILQVDDAGFRGAWRSGVTANTATGHFCALRTGA